jgi:hypothetical protein
MAEEKEFLLTAAEDRYVLESSGLRRSRPGIHPTEASVEYTLDGRKYVAGQCLRSAYYRGMKVPKTNPATSGLIHKADSGKWNEAGLINRWKEMGLWVDNNIKFYSPSYYLSGELDAVLKNPITGKRIGYEVKSFYGYYANKNITGGKRPPVPGRPKTNQFLQALVYAWEYRNELDEYRLYYIERGDGHRVEFRVGFNELPSGEHQAWWQQIPGDYWNFFKSEKVLQPYNVEDVYRRYQKLLDVLKKKQLPAREFSDNCDADTVQWLYDNSLLGKTAYDKFKKKPESNPVCQWQCSYCGFKDRCKTDELAARAKGIEDD